MTETPVQAHFDSNGTPIPSCDVYGMWGSPKIGAHTLREEQQLTLESVGDVRGRNVLYIGCKVVFVASVLAQEGAQVTCVDPDVDLLEAGRLRLEKDGLKLRMEHANLAHLPFADQTYDLVIANFPLCLREDAQKPVLEMARVLKPGGKLYLGELGRWTIWAGLRRLQSYYKQTIWSVVHFRGVGEITELINKAGLHVTSTRGAIFYWPFDWSLFLLAPYDLWIGKRTTWNASYVAYQAIKPL